MKEPNDFEGNLDKVRAWYKRIIFSKATASQRNGKGLK